MANIDPVYRYLLDHKTDSLPKSVRTSAERAFKKIRLRKNALRASAFVLPLVSLFLLIIVLLPKNLSVPRDDILSSNSASAPPPMPESKTVFMSDTDPYYHESDRCAKILGDIQPIMERVARLNGKYLCSVCGTYETAQPLVEAMAIGDIMIFRYEDEYLYGQELTGVFGYDFPVSKEGEEALLEASGYLHAKRYSDFINQAYQNKNASFLARTPDILYLFPGEAALEITDPYQSSLQYPSQTELSSRYIASSHYTICFPDFEPDKTIGVYGRINGIELTLQTDGGAVRLTDSFTMQTIEDTAVYDVRFIDEERPWHSFNEGNFTYSVYSIGNEYVLVIKEEYADPYLLKNVSLRIGETEFTVNGFMDVSGSLDELAENHAYYAVVLTQQEAKSIQSGADISLDHLNFSKIAEASPYNFIPVQYGSGSYGVMDKAGEFVIAPEYKDAWSYQDLSRLYAGGVTGPIILKDYSDTLYLYDGETLDKIAWYSMDGANSKGYAFPRSMRNSINVLGPGIYEFSRDEGVYLLNRTGEVMMSFLYDETGNFENSLYYSATFLHEAVGYPDCIVLYEQKDSYAPDRMWISDLNGNRISNDFERLIPLIWTENRAIFINVAYDRNAAERNFYLPYYEKGLPFSGYEKDKSFRVGLVDQNGNEIAECKYIQLEIIGDQIFLTQENGKQDTISIPR